MRLRKLIISAAVVPIALVGVVGSAGADEHDGTEHGTDEMVPEEVVAEEGEHGETGEGGEISHVGHCVEEAVAEGKDPAECQEAPNPILPETNEIIWGGAAFVILFAVMAKFAFPAVKKGMDDRTERIRGDLDRAETAKAEAEQTLVEYQAQLADARAEANRIIEEARQAADGVKADLQARAEADIADLRARAAADVEAAKSQALSDLRAEVASLAIGAAELVVQKSLDQATQTQLIENYINQVGSSRN